MHRDHLTLKVTRTWWLAVLFLVLPLQAAGHEVRPAIATAVFAPDAGLEIVVTLNLEALIAGIGPDHKETADSQNAPEYDRLRQLGSAELKKGWMTSCRGSSPE